MEDINMIKTFLYAICFKLSLDLDGDVVTMINRVSGKSVDIYIDAKRGIIKIVE